MHVLSRLLLTALAAGAGGAPARPWQKVFDGGDARSVGLIEAIGRGDWVAGGPRGLATARGGRVSIESTHGHGILGLFSDESRGVYALGEGELIWYFDGTRWTEEHVAPLPPRGRRPFAEHMLYVAYREPSTPARSLVATGLKLVLVKRSPPEAGWAVPPPGAQDALRDTGLRGPAITMPARCDRAGWHWLGDSRGAFYCHDRRLFIWDAGTITPRGTMPAACFDTLDALIDVKGTLYASCHAATLWRVEGEAWRPIVSPEQRPKEQRPPEISSLSYADGCLFAAGGGAVWRACGE